MNDSWAAIYVLTWRKKQASRQNVLAPTVASIKPNHSLSKFSIDQETHQETPPLLPPTKQAAALSVTSHRRQVLHVKHRGQPSGVQGELCSSEGGGSDVRQRGDRWTCIVCARACWPSCAAHTDNRVQTTRGVAHQYIQQIKIIENCISLHLDSATDSEFKRSEIQPRFSESRIFFF